jgi:DNA-damage-inducible protein J
MPQTAMIRARIEPQLKATVESLLARLGLNATQAIRLFYRQIELRQGLPFEVAIPNAQTRATLAATDAGRGVIRCKSAKAMFKRLGI